MIKMAISDIDDRQYRHCFEVTSVRERLSFFALDGADLLQLCIYRAASHTFSAAEMNLFATLARLITTTTLKHETLWNSTLASPGTLDIDALEGRLDDLAMGLSQRERQVCARAVVGRTIEETAGDLSIRKTSVITYRQRAYQKLGVSRQTDLLAIVCRARSLNDDEDRRPN